MPTIAFGMTFSGVKLVTNFAIFPGSSEPFEYTASFQKNASAEKIHAIDSQRQSPKFFVITETANLAK